MRVQGLGFRVEGFRLSAFDAEVSELDAALTSCTNEKLTNKERQPKGQKRAVNLKRPPSVHFCRSELCRLNPARNGWRLPPSSPEGSSLGAFGDVGRDFGNGNCQRQLGSN